MRAFVIICMLLLVTGCGRSKPPEPTAQQTSEQISEQKTQQVVTEYLVESVKRELKDPDSAQLKDVTYYVDHKVFKNGHRATGAHKVCGKINAKNSFGGYIGYQNFLSTVVLNSAEGTVREESLFSMIDDPSIESRHQLFLKFSSEFCANHEERE